MCRANGRSAAGAMSYFGQAGSNGASSQYGSSRGSASGLPPRHEALSYIRAHSDDHEDLLPGLCLFIERWLAQVGKCRFQGLTGTSDLMGQTHLSPPNSLPSP